MPRSYKTLDYDDGDEDYHPAGSSTVPHLMPTRKNPGRRAKALIAADMSGFVHPFEGLQKLQVVSDARAAQFDIHPRVICWKDKKERALYGGFMPTDETMGKDDCERGRGEKKPYVPLFVSQPDEIENRDGICVQLTVERLLKLVKEGLVVHTDRTGMVVGIDDFTFMSP
ncbi:hypothetical protein B0H11DRAFT_1922979 [Mycena galericulata]|nr:hypothetical protein B0H11DRAFT_1922979 [Mycena galericulata]